MFEDVSIEELREIILSELVELLVEHRNELERALEYLVKNPSKIVWDNNLDTPSTRFIHNKKEYFVNTYHNECHILEVNQKQILSVKGNLAREVYEQAYKESYAM